MLCRDLHCAVVQLTQYLLQTAENGTKPTLLCTEGKAISVSAEASDRNGKIARVEFWVKDMASFMSPNLLVATVTTAPYTASIKDLKPGHYMLWAIAADERGGTTQSVPTHFMIRARK